MEKLEKMKKEEKRIYLNREKKESLVKGFLENCPAGTIFGRNEIMAFMIGLDMFKKQPESIRKARLEDLVRIMRESFDTSVKQLGERKPGDETKWQKTSTTSDSKEVKEVSEPSKSSTKSSCGVKKLERLYNLIKYATTSSIGISKEDAQSILGYHSKIQESGVNSLNDIFERETGFRPLRLNKEHRFIDRDILSVDHEVSALIMEELLDKLKGQEPKFKYEGEYEKEVKSIMRHDYRTLLLFTTTDGTLKFQRGASKAKEFRTLVCGSRTVAAEKVAAEFKELLLKRYDIDIDVIGLDRSYFKIDKEDVNAALIKIEEFFAKYFCEKIVDTLMSEKEARKANELSDKEVVLLGTVENIFEHFSKDNKLFLSQLWGMLQDVGLPGGEWLPRLLKKSGKFTTGLGKTESGVTAQTIEYKPEPKPQPEPVIKEVVKEVLVAPKPSPIREVVIGFENPIDRLSEIRGFLDVKELQKYRDDYLYKIGIDCENKRSILEFLKIYYSSLTTNSITVICENSSQFVSELESKLTK